MLFEVFFFFFCQSAFPRFISENLSPTAHHIFHRGVWNLGGQLGGGVACVLVQGLAAPPLDSRTEFPSDRFRFSFFL